jgi:hypothetical protein
MMAVLSAFIPCVRTCSLFMHHILLLTLCAEMYCIIRMADVTCSCPLSTGLSMESAMCRLRNFVSK